MNATNHFKIGLFIVAGLGLFIAGLFAFGARTYFEPKTTYETYVQGDVEGLSVGSPVELRGVNVGKVTHIGFTWNIYPDTDKGSILVEFEIPQSLNPTRGSIDFPTRLQSEIKKGLRARVKSMSVTGTSFVSLEYVSPEDNPEPPLRWQPRYYYIPSAESQFSQMLSSIEKTLRNVEKVDFQKIADALDSNLDLMSKIFRKIGAVDVAGIGTNIQGVLVSTRKTSDDLQVFIEEARGTVKNMHLENVGQSAETLLNRLTQSNDRLRVLLDSVDMQTANAAMDSIRQAAAQVQEVLADFKRYPSGYFLGEPPRPATAVKPAK